MIGNRDAVVKSTANGGLSIAIGNPKFGSYANINVSHGTLRQPSFNTRSVVGISLIVGGSLALAWACQNLVKEFQKKKIVIKES